MHRPRYRSLLRSKNKLNSFLHHDANKNSIVNSVSSSAKSLYNSDNGAKIRIATELCDNQVPSNTILHYFTSQVSKNQEAFKTSITNERISPLFKTTYTYGDMSMLSSQFGQFLSQELKLKKQDRVAVMLPKTPELMISALGIWRCGATYVPLFTAFGPEAIMHRMNDCGAQIIITDENNRAKLDQIPEIVSNDRIKIITVHHGHSPARGVSLSSKKGAKEYDFYGDALSGSATTTSSNNASIMECEPVKPDDCMILLYTSGTTGKPKGVMVTAKALNAFETYMTLGFHFKDERYANDSLRFWNLADTGWAYGMYYGLIGPLLHGETTRFVNAPFKPATVYSILEEEQINNFAAAPTAYRAMMAEGDSLIKKYNFFVDRASSAGEPLNPEAIRFFEKYWGARVHDHYGQTESGMTVCQLHHPDHASDLSFTSMGKAMSGFNMKILDSDLNEITKPNVSGLLAIDVPNSPLNFFGGYWNSESKTKERVVRRSDGHVFELTGDTAWRDEQGHFFFGGRADDVITSSGFRVGPKEIEDVLIEHPAVKESGVVGKPDELRGEAIVAFVVLLKGHSASEPLAEELKMHVKDKLARHLAPKEIHFVDDLPYTEAGKIRRNVLRQRLLQQQ